MNEIISDDNKNENDTMRTETAKPQENKTMNTEIEDTTTNVQDTEKLTTNSDVTIHIAQQETMNTETGDSHNGRTIIFVATDEEAASLRAGGVDAESIKAVEDLANSITTPVKVVLLFRDQTSRSAHNLVRAGARLMRVGIPVVAVCRDRRAAEDAGEGDGGADVVVRWTEEAELLPLFRARQLPQNLGDRGWDARIDEILDLILEADEEQQNQTLEAICAQTKDLWVEQLRTALRVRYYLKHQEQDLEKQDDLVQGMVRLALEDTIIWVQNTLRLSNSSNVFYEWIEGEWRPLTVQQFCKRFGVSDRSPSFIRRLCHYLFMQAQVQGVPNSEEMVDKVVLRNGTFDFSTGKLGPVLPEDKMLFSLARTYLAPDQRMPEDQNRVYQILGAYDKEVVETIRQSVMPRVVAPWPGGKHINFVGLPGTGKNKLIQLLRRLVANNVCSIDTGSRWDRHATSRLVNQFMNYTNEGKRTRIRNMEAWKDEADSRTMEVNPKAKELFTTRNMCTSVHAMNVMFQLPARGSEYWRRLLIVPFIKRLKGVAGGNDFIDKAIEDLTNWELDSAWSAAADLAVEHGPDGTYGKDLSADDTAALYEELVDPFQFFLQSELRWTDSREPIFFKDIIDRYKESDYSFIDHKAKIRDDQSREAMHQKIRTFCSAMNGLVKRERKDSCHTGVLAVIGLAWGRSNHSTTNILGRFTPVQEDELEQEESSQALEPIASQGEPEVKKPKVRAATKEDSKPASRRGRRPGKQISGATSIDVTVESPVDLQLLVPEENAERDNPEKAAKEGETLVDQAEIAPMGVSTEI